MVQAVARSTILCCEVFWGELSCAEVALYNEPLDGSVSAVLMPLVL